MKPLVIFAMEQESQNVFDDFDVLYTGIGKVNASYALTKRLQEAKPSLLINMGTAGSRKHQGGSIVNCTGFVQRDMDVTALGFEKWQTPFSSDPVHIEHGVRLDNLPNGVCGSGDNFDTSDESSSFDVVDMEAYALALIAQREGIPFLCLKYVSDGANDNATQDWNESLKHTAQALRQVLDNISLDDL